MVGSAYKDKDLSASNNPLTSPEVIEAAIKLAYHKNLIGRKLLGYQNLSISTVSTIEEADTVGDVDWLSENGALPKLDFAFVKGTKRVRPYGGWFEVTEEQQEDNLEDEIRVMINNTAYAMSYFEDLVIYNDIINATGINSIDATHPWDVSTGADAGVPLKDLQKAKRTVSAATKGQKPDTIVISELTFEYLTAFDAIKNRLYNTQGADGYVVTGQVPTLLGMVVVQDDAVDPNDTGQCLVFKQKDIGVWQERYAIRTKSIPGSNLGKDQIAFKYTAKAKGEPNIKFPKLGCIINDLFTT
ncbi:hypothetical protein [Methanoregula sp.]|uniref:phage major capsid protein n=1 Tax=Methanoregula sp. TaxID=2052170 RepID=UPI000CC441C6|nr:hypothetical protein [Methanoregula sp.]PKG32409.1 MAG: hypothetical protein CW742_08325 [Methanoregula sp.]